MGFSNRKPAAGVPMILAVWRLGSRKRAVEDFRGGDSIVGTNRPSAMGGGRNGGASQLLLTFVASPKHLSTHLVKPSCCNSRTSAISNSLQKLNDIRVQLLRKIRFGQDWRKWHQKPLRSRESGATEVPSPNTHTHTGATGGARTGATLGGLCRLRKDLRRFSRRGNELKVWHSFRSVIHARSLIPSSCV